MAVSSFTANVWAMRTTTALAIATGVLVGVLAVVVVLNGGWAPGAARHALFLATPSLLALLALLATGGRAGPRGPTPAMA